MKLKYPLEKSRAMSKYLLILFVLVALGSNAQEYGDIETLDKKNGFKSITLGDSVNGNPNLVYLGDANDGIKFYDVVNEDLKIGDIPLESVSVAVFKELISQILVMFDKDNGYKIHRVIEKAYGFYTERPNRFMDHFIWESTIVKLSLNYDVTENKGVLIFTSKPIKELEIKFRDSRDKEAIGDL